MFRISIRELLLVTLVVALTLGWWIDRSRYKQAHDSLLQEYMRVQQSRSELLDMVRKMHLSLQTLNSRSWHSAAEKSQQREKPGLYK